MKEGLVGQVSGWAFCAGASAMVAVVGFASIIASAYLQGSILIIWGSVLLVITIAKVRQLERDLKNER